jgi:hypothetical protein
MGADYKGLMRGNHGPIDLAKMIADLYGSDRFSVDICDFEGFYRINFKERPTTMQMTMRPWERAKLLRDRSLAVFTDGDCACDYADLTTEPMTIISLGRHGDCEEIITALVGATGGWIMDEAGDQEWHEYGINPPATPPVQQS